MRLKVKSQLNWREMEERETDGSEKNHVTRVGTSGERTLIANCCLIIIEQQFAVIQF